MVEKKISLPGFHPLRFFSKLGEKEKNPAYFVSGTWTVIAWNPRRTITEKDARVFDELKKLPKNTSRLPFSGGAIGYCCYQLGCELQGVHSRHSSALPLAIFHVYDSALLWNGKELFLVGSDYDLGEVEAIHLRPFSGSSIDAMSFESSLKKSEYKKNFSQVMHGIRDGDFYQLNLSYPFVASSSEHSRKIFVALAEANPASSTSYFESDSTAIISLSPERFVTIKNGIITTCPIKGTRPRGGTLKEDKRLAAELLASPKETAELNMIVDLLRNDIGKVSATGTVKVLRHRVLQQNQSVWHTYSVIQGRLEKNIHPVDAFASMFPGGSVTGCPKVAAMKEIDRLEDQSRGAYCGSMLLLSRSGFLDSTILIRTIVQEKTKLTLGMGGGIVSDSNCHQEFDETLKKAQPFLTFSKLYSARYFRGTREISADSVTTMFDLRQKTMIGVFETMRADQRHIHDLAAHLKRFRNSAELLHIRIPQTKVLTKQLRSAVKKSPSNILRVKIVCTKKDICIETRPLLGDPAREHGIAVTILPVDRTLPEAKALPYDREYTAHHEAGRRGYGEALLRRADGSIPESAYSNVFFVKDQTLWTAEDDMLPGITRAQVLRIARRLKIPVRYVSLQETDLWHAEEIFLTSSLHGVTPVIRLDTEPVGSGKPGKLTKVLQKAFDKKYR